NVFAAPQPSSPAAERGVWYQYYFNTERGRAGLQQNRKALCRFLWETWSPTWHFTDETYNRTAPSFDNPDFVDIVIHSYRHRIGNAPGDPRFLETERRLAERPKINVQVIKLYGANEGIPRLAAVLVYYAICSMPPLMMIAIAAIGFFYSGNIIERVQTQLATLVGDETAKTLLTGVQMQGQKGGLIAGLTGIGILLFGASG